MTSKEKARELYDKYWLIVDTKSVNKCALIAVDEIIESCNFVNKWYWQEVKQEVEKL